MNPHKHAELIKAWADGAEIEYLSERTNCWWSCTSPDWLPHIQYRIKPEPDQISYLLLSYPNKDKWFEYDYPCEHDCIKIVRDRKTGKLKSAEVI